MDVPFTLRSAFEERTPGRWLREQANIPIYALCLGFVVETASLWIFPSGAHEIIEGELLRGGGFLLAALVLLSLTSVLDAYYDAIPSVFACRGSVRDIRDRAQNNAFRVAVIYPLAIILHSLSAVLGLTDGVKSCVHTNLSVSNGVVLVAALLWGYAQLVEARRLIIEDIKRGASS